MPVPVHPGRLLPRELKARALSANRLALDLGAPPAASPISSTSDGRSAPIRRSGSAAISAIGRNSGSTCKANPIWPSSSANAASRSKDASAPPTQRNWSTRQERGADCALVGRVCDPVAGIDWDSAGHAAPDAHDGIKADEEWPHRHHLTGR